MPARLKTRRPEEPAPGSLTLDLGGLLEAEDGTFEFDTQDRLFDVDGGALIPDSTPEG